MTDPIMDNADAAGTGLKWTNPAEPINAHYLMLKRSALVVVGNAGEDFLVYGRFVVKEIGVPKPVGLAILRELRDEGLIRLRVAFDEDMGTPAGSGYMLTPAGHLALSRPKPDV